MIDTNLGAARLLDFLSDQTLPSISLLEATGQDAWIKLGWSPSGLETRIATAWQIAMSDLTCAQCRMLVGQKLGIRWLAGPVLAFVTKYPRAECDLFPGDLTVISIIEWRELAFHEPGATRAMLSQDYNWLRLEAELDDWDGSIVKRAVATLDAAIQA